MDWDPFEHFRRIHHELERALGQTLHENGDFRPAAANVYETETGVIAEFELPGVDKRDIAVNVTADEVEVRVERKEERESKQKRFYRHEARALSFYRKISLPVEIVPGKAKAAYRNGILRIEAPKAKPSDRGGRTLTVE
jgi:HSP20 family protein